MTSHSLSTERSSTEAASRLNVENSAELDRKASDYSGRQIDPSPPAQDRKRLNATKPTSPFHQPALLQEDLSVFLHLFRKGFLVHVIHLDYFNFIRIGYRRINSFASNKLADSSHQSQSFFAQEKVDKGFSRIRMWGPGSKRDRLAISHELTESHVIQRHALLAVENDVLYKSDSNRSFSCGDPLAGWSQRGYQQRLGCGQVPDKLVCLFLATHHFMEIGHPLSGRRVLAGIGYYDFTLVLRLCEILQRLRRIGGFDYSGMINNAD